MIRRCGLIETFAEFSYGPECSVPRPVKWNRGVFRISWCPYSQSAAR